MASNREKWLIKAVQVLKKEIFEPKGYKVPQVRVSVGFTGARKSKAIGSCWNKEAAKDQVAQIFISPVIDQSFRVLDILAHELIHAIYPKAGHRGSFRKAALDIGLTGKMTATVAGPELRECLNALIKTLGDYHHASLNIDDFRKKQSTRLLKAECQSCGYIIRVTKKWAEMGLPECMSSCGGHFRIGA